MLAVFAIARVSTVEEFGALSLAFAAIMAAVALCRGLLGTPITLLSDRPDLLGVETKHALAVAGSIGAISTVGIAAIGCLTDYAWSVALIALAAPFVLLQDSARFGCIASARPRLAVHSDGLWAGCSAILFVVTCIPAVSTPPEIIVAGWTAAAIASAALIQFQSQMRPVWQGLHSWLQISLGDRIRYAMDGAIGATNSFVFLAITAGLIGTIGIAALRGAASVMGPLSILLSSLPLVMVPELRRQLDNNYWSPMRKVGIGLSSLAIVVGLISIFVPDAIGKALLGETWSVAHPLLPITAVEYALLSWSGAAQSVLRAQLNSRAILQVRITYTIAVVAFALVAALAFGTARSVAISLVAAVTLATAAAVGLTLSGKETLRPPRANSD